MINKGKRDILIFPEFDNIDLIENIRKKYDPLYGLIKPHITLAFPFSDEMTNEFLISKLSNLTKLLKSFDVAFKGTSISHDNYIFLNQIYGNEKIIRLHDLIYSNILPTHLNSDIKYIPHITIGRLFGDDTFNEDFPYEFKTTIDKICIEQIGEHEESIIIKEINLTE